MFQKKAFEMALNFFGNGFEYDSGMALTISSVMTMGMASRSCLGMALRKRTNIPDQV